ncbi:MAG: helix-turn-helix transcriptional regulator [Gammaproteobacteria bacterium]|nr:helix-turn-helix transcriptional regulator [Gammaproteobacteria bacterium]
MSAVGSLLSEYRKRHHMSQLDLGILADVSSRHISFIETGRSQPSRNMLLRLATVMGLPFNDSNLLLNSGGFTAVYSSLDLNSPEMEPIRFALNLMLEKQNPYPALVMDGNWNILMMNKAQQLMSSRLLPDLTGSETHNLLELVFDHRAFRPLISNWNQVAAHLLRHLRKQMLAYSKPGHVELYNRLLAMAPPVNWQQPEANTSDFPMLTLDITSGGKVLRMFSTLSQFGTALDVGMEELIIESYFPANQASHEFFSSLGSTASL